MKIVCLLLKLSLIHILIRSIYEALDGMGFEKGNILEPSMGVGGFKTCHLDFCLRIQLLRNTPCDGIQFHTIQSASQHGDVYKRQA